MADWMKEPFRESDQELEEDGRTAIACARDAEGRAAFRAYFADGTYVEVEGMEILYEEGHPTGEGEEWGPGWESCGWYDLPWKVRERIRLFEEEAMGLSGEELARDLLPLPYPEQLRLVAESPGLHRWGLAHFLLEKSREAAPSDPRKAAELARLAEHLTGFFGGYAPERVSELRARCLACLADALRLSGEPESAEEAFRDAADCLDRSEGQVSRLVRAEILSLRASLLRELRRSEEAISFLREAQGLFEAEGALPLAEGARRKQEEIREEMRADG